MNVGFDIRNFRSSRTLDEGGSTCSFEQFLPSFPNDIFVNFDFSLFFFFIPLLSTILFPLLKVSSALNELSSTTLVPDLFIKSSAKETLGLGSRFTEAREEIDERN